MRAFLVYIFFLFFVQISWSQKSKVDSLKNDYKNAKEDTTKIKMLLNIGKEFYYTNPDSSLRYCLIAKQQAEILEKKTESNYASYLLSKSIYEVAYIESQIMQYEEAEKMFFLSIEKINIIVSNSINNNEKYKSLFLKSQVLSGIADIYYDKGYYSIALNNYIEARKITDKLIQEGFIDESQNAGQYFHIGMIHYELKNYEKALLNYEKSLEISKRINYELGVAKCKNNIAIIKLEVGDADYALKYYKDVLKFVEKNKILIMQAQVYDNIADCYISKKEYDKAELYLAKSSVIVKKINNKQGEIYVNLTLSKLYLTTKKYDKAIFFSEKAVKISKEIKSLALEKNAYEQLYKIFQNKKNYKEALFYHVKFKSLEDTLFNKAKNNQIEEAEAKYNSTKKQNEINRQKIELAKKDEKLKRKNVQTIALITLAILLILFIIYIYYSLKLKQKATKYIRAQNKKITDSIEYAKKIQTAALPSELLLKDIFEDHFVLFKPLQIVSGDFYWAMKKNEYSIFALADCTGHGIPGAFISIFGISLLNELILNSDLTRPDTILEEMRFYLKKSLSQTGKFEEQTDGIDIALCIINNKTDELFYAGANQSAYLMRKGEIEELMPVMNPVGIYPKEISFKMHKRKLKEGDIIYLFSDGYVDQFGGDTNKSKKFTIQKFNNILSEIYLKPLIEQNEILETEFQKWKNTNNQLDDVLVFGIKY